MNWLSLQFIAPILFLFSSFGCNQASLGFNSTNCPNSFFDCGNDRCIAHFWRCDGEDDCGNWADEHLCSNNMSMEIPHTKKTCPHNHSHCNDTKDTCIPNKWLCDGMIDCDTGFDEHNCTKETVQCMGFVCQNFECIPKRWKCDGIPDCNDGSDELDCPTKTKQLCDKEHGFYQCLTGECISHIRVCDNHTDCPQGDDEGTECRPQGCHNTKCTQLCFVGPHGPQCYCRSGYHIDKDNTTCIDIDECLQNKKLGLCSHFCTNQEGGYRCGCHEGYQLINNRSCIVKEEEPLLLFSNSEGIRGLSLRSGNYFPVYHSLGQTVGLDFLNSEERVYWVNSDKDNSGVYSVELNADGFKPVVTNGLKGPEDMAIDWIGRNIYITDNELNAIIVCRLDGLICVSQLFGQIDKPRAIVVDPPNGYVYWTEWGNSSGIYRAGMDGSQKEHLIKDLVWPNGLALDTMTNRLYWTEARLGRIEFLDLTTYERRTVVSDRVFHPFALAVFEEWIYWSDWRTYSLEKSHKFSGHNQTIMIREINEMIKGVHVFHPLTQKASYDPCWLHSCSHMCVLAPERRHSCVCPEHLVLGKDRKTCLPKPNDTFLMISLGEEVKMLYPEAIGSDVTIEIDLPRGLVIGDIAFNWNTKTLYVFDAKRLAIGSFELEKPSLDLLNPSEDHFWNPIITTQLDRVDGLTYDSNTDLLYWLETRAGILEVSTTDGKSRAILVDHLDNPIDLALHPESHRMYVAVMGTDPHIMVADMDGQNRKVLIASKTGFAVSLAIDMFNDILYWADAKNGLIEYFKLSAPKGHPSRKGVVARNLGHVMSIAVQNDTIFWTDIDSNYIYHQNLDKNQRHSKLAINLAQRGKSVKKLWMASEESKPRGPCSQAKGGCSHICLLGKFGATCMCPFGYALLKDGHNCQKLKDMSDNELCPECVPSGHNDDSELSWISFENSEEDDFNWISIDEDEEAAKMFDLVDKQRNESTNEMKNSVSEDHAINGSTAHTFMTTNIAHPSTTSTPTTAAITEEITAKPTKRVRQQKHKTGYKNTKDRDFENRAKAKDSEAIVSSESIGSEAEESPKKGWLTLFVAALIFAIIVLLIALIVKKDEYRDVRNMFYPSADRLGVVVRFKKSLFGKSKKNADEEEPLNCDNQSLNDEKY